MKLGIVGVGNMGSAFIAGLSKNNDFEICAYDPNLDHDVKELNVKFYNKFNSELNSCEYILLACKPQQAEIVCKDLNLFLSENICLISILAGSAIDKIKSFFSKKIKIVRAMPNLPAKINKGVTGFFADDLSELENINVIKILSAVGEVVRLNSEDQVDIVTAISGSGPGYVFYFMEALIQAAIEMGLDEQQAKLLVEETFVGASLLKKFSENSAKELREQVTSKGGTTEAALRTFKEEEVFEKIIKSAKSAYFRAKQLK